MVGLIQNFVEGLVRNYPEFLEFVVIDKWEETVLAEGDLALEGLYLLNVP